MSMSEDEALSLALIEAVVADDRAKVRRVLASGAGVDALDAAGRRPLHLARSLGVVELLLAHGAEVNVHDANGVTPLMVHAGRGGALDVVESLLARGADPSAQANGSNAMTWAARADDLPVAARLLAAGSPIDAEPEHTGPLHAAVARGNLALVEWLLDRGADVEAVDRGPFGTLGPLHLAAIYDHADIAKLLLDRGASARAGTRKGPEDTLGCTPLHFAAEYGHLEVLAALLRRDPDAIACTSAAGKRAWDLAEDRLIKALLLTVGRGATVDEFERLRAGKQRERAGFWVGPIAPEAVPTPELPELLRRLAPASAWTPCAAGVWLASSASGELAIGDARGVRELGVRAREWVVGCPLDARKLLVADLERGIVEIDLTSFESRVVVDEAALAGPVRALGYFDQGVLVHSGEQLAAHVAGERVWSLSTEPLRAVFLPGGPLVALTPRASLIRALWCVADRSGLRPHSRFEPRVTEVWALRGPEGLRWFAAGGRGETWEIHGVAGMRSDREVLVAMPDADAIRGYPTQGGGLGRSVL
ncbi:ankyrin repeat domain-containing protein [Nannocystaceae bacterium ST9]